ELQQRVIELLEAEQRATYAGYEEMLELGLARELARSGGPQNLDRPLRWEAVRFPKGVNHEEEASESLAGVQGQGGLGSRAGREDPRGVVARVRGARQPDRRLEAAVAGGRLGLVHAGGGA